MLHLKIGSDIPKQPKESVFGCVGFTSKFQAFTRALPPAMVTRSKPKILRSLLAKKRFFRLFRYREQRQAFEVSLNLKSSSLISMRPILLGAKSIL